ncbi:MAG: FecR domain-containing protein, partial [Bdellovibrionota bacterium]
MAKESRKTYWILFLVPLLLAGVVSYFLWRDFQEDAAVGRKSTKVAAILDHHGVVKRRPEDRFRWFKVSLNHDIFAGDSLATGGESKMEIEFPDGTLIDLGEHTLFTIEKRDNGNVAINVSSGTFTYKAGTKKGPGGAPIAPAPRVEALGKVLDISKSEGTVDARDGAVSVNVTKGTAVIKNGSIVDKVDAGNSLETGSDGSVQRADLRFKLISPPRGSILQAPSGETATAVDFAWQQPKTGSSKLEISSVLSFSKTWQSFPLGDTQQLRITLPIGRYFWRLTDGAGNSSVASAFEIVQNDGIRLLEPAPGASVASVRGGTDLLFSWEAGAAGDAYRLLISDDAAFRNLLRDEKVQSGAKAFVNLKQSGHFYWKVEGTSGGQPRKPSDVRQFSITAPAPIPSPAAPRFADKAVETRKPFEALAPKQGAQVLLGANRDGERQKQKVLFSWKAPSAQKAVVFKLYKVNSHGAYESILERQLTGGAASVAWIASELGGYRWDIGSELYHSQVDFKVAPANLSMETPLATIVGSTDPKNGKGDHRLLQKDLIVQLKWKPVAGALNYRVMFSKDSDFETLELEREVTGLSTKVVSKDFLYTPVFYKVATTLKDGQTVMSAPGRFTFKFQPPVPKVPKDKQSFPKNADG